MSQEGSLIPKRRRKESKPTAHDRLEVAGQTKRLMVIEHNGITRYEPFTGTEPELEQLQRIVGGYIERVPHRFELDGHYANMFVCEDGNRLNFPPNVKATMLTGGLHRIVGNAVLVPTGQMARSRK